MTSADDAGPCIREATTDDAPVAARLIREAFADVARRFNLSAENCPSHPSSCRASWITGDMEQGARYYLCYEGREVRGCYGLIRTREQAGRLDRLAVAPEHQGRGLGALLLDDARRRAGDAGMILLEVSILHENDGLLRWYTKRGFELSATARYPHLPFTAGFLFADVER